MTRTHAFLIVLALGLCIPADAAAATKTASVTSAADPSDPLFDDAVLQEIHLLVNARDWQTLKADALENTYYPCDFRWGGQVVRNAGIRSRGNGSRSGTKPGLRLDFDRYSADQTFLGLKSVVLRNNTQDASNMHERLAMQLFRRVGLPTPREAYAKLFVNNEYAGLYTIVESIDKHFLKQTFNENDGYLYKYESAVDAAPYYFNYLGPAPELYVPLPFKPETHENDARPEFIEQLARTISEADRPSFRSAMSGFVDLEKFVRHVAVENFLADNDGILGKWGMNNFYLYRLENTTRFEFLTWDRSESFKGGSDYPILRNIADVPSWARNRLMDSAMNQPDLADLYLDTLLACARSVTEIESGSSDDRGWLVREIMRQYAQISAAALTDPVKPYSNDEFVGAVQDLLAFASSRSGFVQQEVSRLRRP